MKYCIHICRDEVQSLKRQAVDFFRPVESTEQPYSTGKGPNLWPLNHPQLKSVAEDYIEHLEALGQQVMSAIATGLGVDQSILLSRTNKAFWNLRILGYEGRKVKRESFAGIGEHTGTLSLTPTRAAVDRERDDADKTVDFGILTFLLTDPTKQSLQVLGKNGDWIWADPIEASRSPTPGRPY